MATSSVTTEDSSPIFFWREYGGGEYVYMSQWYHSPFHTDDDSSVVYRTAEQYMMYQKAILFSDHEIAAQILKTTSPKEQKALGRKVKNFTQDVWEANRERIVEEGSYFKFKNGKDEGEGKHDGVGLRAKLLGTGDREIVEASPMVGPNSPEHCLRLGVYCQLLMLSVSCLEEKSSQDNIRAPKSALQGNANPNFLGNRIESGAWALVQRMQRKGGKIGA